jgi:hypothetical protein
MLHRKLNLCSAANGRGAMTRGPTTALDSRPHKLLRGARRSLSKSLARLCLRADLVRITLEEPQAVDAH